MNPGVREQIRGLNVIEETHSPMAPSRVVVATVAVAALMFGLRLAVGPQLDGLDDAGYLEAAQHVSLGQSLDGLGPLFRTRVGMAYPLGWLIRANWIEPSQFWLLTMAGELVTFVALFATGWLLRGAVGALCVTALYASYPLAVQQSVMYFPTAFQVASIASATALVMWGERGSVGRRLGFGLAAGVCLGLGYLVKEDAAIVVAALAVTALVVRFPRLGTAVAVCVGAALVFSAETLVYWRLTGHAAYRLTAASGSGFVAQDHLRIGSIYHWDAYLKALWLLPIHVGIYWWLAIPALWTAFRDRRRLTIGPPLAFMAVLSLLIFAYLQFGSGSMSSFSPLPKGTRYTALISPFLVLLTGVWIARLFEWRRAAGMFVLAAAIATSIPCIIFLAASSSERSRNTLGALSALDQVGSAPLYTDYYSARLLRLLKPSLINMRPWYHARFEKAEMVILSQPADAPGAFVFLDHQMSKIYTSSYEMALPPSIATPPEAWRVVSRRRAYSEGSLTRSLLEAARSMSGLLGENTALSKKIHRSVSEMIDGDEAILYQVPE